MKTLIFSLTQSAKAVIIAFFSFLVINISAIEKPQSFDLQEFIDIEINARKNPIIIPPGVYKLKPINKGHLYFKNLRNLTLIADSVKVVCSETTRAITFDNCENLTLKGLTIDYDPLCFTQGRIIRMTEDKSEIEIKLDENYPDDFELRIEIFDAKTLTLKSTTHYGWTDFVKTGKRTYKTTKGPKYKYNPERDKEEIGDILVTNNFYATNGYMPHAVYSNECRNLKLQNITLYSSNSFGFFETNGTKNVYQNCRVERPAPEHDLYIRPQRIRSANADAFHSKYAYIGPQIIACEASFQGDDCVNICGKYYYSTGASANTIHVISAENFDLRTGASLEILSSKGEKIPSCKILKIEEKGLPTADDIKGLTPLKIRDVNKEALSGAKAKVYCLTVDREINLEAGALIADKNRMGSGFLVKDCVFGYNRSRGILIKASDGKVTGNKLEENWKSAILVSPEAYWLESGCSDNLEISNNQIIRNKSINSITIDAKSTSGELVGPGLHNNINILNNRFVDCPLPCVTVSVTKGGDIRNNVIESTSDNPSSKWLILDKCADITTDITAP